MPKLSSWAIGAGAMAMVTYLIAPAALPPGSVWITATTLCPNASKLKKRSATTGPPCQL
jgi:hypothetical protein